jgi:hypothetical protein
VSLASRSREAETVPSLLTARPAMTATPTPAPATPTTATAGGRIQRSTRIAVGGLLALGLPGHADTGYAWAIRPPIAAAFLGAGYLAGIVATALVVFTADRWRSAQPLAVALVTLSLGLLAATLLHTDRFKWDYPPTWAWTAVYALAPIGVVVLARRQRAATYRPTFADPRLNLLRALSLAFGLALAAGAVALFAFPSALGGDWPWPLTPLLAQAVASWVAMIAAALLWCAYDLRRGGEAFIPYATLGAWCLALLALPALHAGDLTRTGAPLLTYLGVLLALLALAGLGVSRAGRLAL